LGPGFGVEQVFGQVNVTIACMLGFTQSVDSSETMNRHMAGIALFRE